MWLGLAERRTQVVARFRKLKPNRERGAVGATAPNVSVDGKEIYSEVKWPPRWYLPFAAAGLILTSLVLRLVS